MPPWCIKYWNVSIPEGLGQEASSTKLCGNALHSELEIRKRRTKTCLNEVLRWTLWYVTKIPLSQRTCQSSHWGHTWQMASSCREPPHPAHACFQDGSMQHWLMWHIKACPTQDSAERLFDHQSSCKVGWGVVWVCITALLSARYSSFPLPSTGMDSRALPNKHPAHGSPSQERLLRESNLDRCWELMLTNFAQHMKSFNLENNPVRYVELSSIYREGNWGFKRSSRQQLNCFWVYTQVCLAAELMGWRIILVGEEGRLK